MCKQQALKSFKLGYLPNYAFNEIYIYSYHQRPIWNSEGCPLNTPIVNFLKSLHGFGFKLLWKFDLLSKENLLNKFKYARLVSKVDYHFSTRGKVGYVAYKLKLRFVNLTVLMSLIGNFKLITDTFLM